MKEIFICEACDGRGTVGHSELTDYHKGEYKYWNTVCRTCNGSGRLIKTTTVKIEPYDNSEVTMLLLKDSDDK